MARNRAFDIKEFSESFNKSYNYDKKDTKYCIFISHRQEDSVAAKKIGEYILTKANIDIYLDQRDSGLQWAVIVEDDKAIVAHIERGINNCTHILCLVSDETKKSWWVPYEIGFAKKAEKKIMSLKLKNVEEIPSFLKIETTLNGTKSLNKYLERIKNPYYTLISESTTNHPLDNYLNWQE